MSRPVMGFILVLIGAAVILNRINLNIVPVHLYWPLWLLIPGIGFQIGFFVRPHVGRAGLLMPGGILTVLGIVFFLERLPSFGHFVLWPLILLAPATGFLEMYFFGRRAWRHLLAGGLLLLVAAVAYINLFVMQSGAVLLGAAFVVIGIYVIVRPLLKRDDHR